MPNANLLLPSFLTTRKLHTILIIERGSKGGLPKWLNAICLGVEPSFRIRNLNE